MVGVSNAHLAITRDSTQITVLKLMILVRRSMLSLRDARRATQGTVLVQDQPLECRHASHQSPTRMIQTARNGKIAPALNVHKDRTSTAVDASQ